MYLSPRFTFRHYAIAPQGAVIDRTILRANSDYFPTQHPPAGLYNGDTMCFL